jgi:hypothetical protein
MRIYASQGDRGGIFGNTIASSMYALERPLAMNLSTNFPHYIVIYLLSIKISLQP